MYPAVYRSFTWSYAHRIFISCTGPGKRGSITVHDIIDDLYSVTERPEAGEPHQVTVPRYRTVPYCTSIVLVGEGSTVLGPSRSRAVPDKVSPFVDNMLERYNLYSWVALG